MLVPFGLTKFQYSIFKIYITILVVALVVFGWLYLSRNTSKFNLVNTKSIDLPMCGFKLNYDSKLFSSTDTSTVDSTTVVTLLTPMAIDGYDPSSVTITCSDFLSEGRDYYPITTKLPILSNQLNAKLLINEEQIDVGIVNLQDNQKGIYIELYFGPESGISLSSKNVIELR